MLTGNRTLAGHLGIRHPPSAVCTAESFCTVPSIEIDTHVCLLKHSHVKNRGMEMLVYEDVVQDMTIDSLRTFSRIEPCLLVARPTCMLKECVSDKQSVQCSEVQ